MKWLKRTRAWVPDDEHSLIQWLNKKGLPVGKTIEYQPDKVQRALEIYPHRRGVAVDVGAFVGLWTRQLAQHFEVVHAFEPVMEHARCLHRNNTTADGQPALNVHVHEYALGDCHKRIGMRLVPGNGGLTHVVPGEDYTQRALDEVLPDAQVDMVKIDAEGYECQVIEGMRRTLERCRPAMVVEAREEHEGRYQGDAIEVLEAMGARVLDADRGDVFLAWD